MDMTGAVADGGTDSAELDEIGHDRTEYLHGVRTACDRFIQEWIEAERVLGGSAGTLPAAAASQRAATRRFLDAQRALLARRARLDAEVSATGRAAREDAAATIADARSRAGLPPATEEFPHSPDGVDQLTIEWFDPEPSLGAVLDTWWELDGAACDSARADAAERASVVRQLARIEAGEVMADWSVPSTLPAPSPEATTMPSLPPSLLTVLEHAALAPIEEICDELLTALGGVSHEPGSERPEPAVTFAPPSGSPVASAASATLPAPTVGASVGDSIEPGSRPATEPDVAETLAPSGPDDFDRFWQYPDRHGGSSARLVRQLVLSMAATTAGLALVLAWIG